jgi:acyl-coenzyme A thioesterase PaaI-like protein
MLEGQGPPGRVHGGCIFAVLDECMAKSLFSRGQTDLGVPAGLMVTGGMSVDYKNGAPLDEVHLIVCKMLGARVDGRGRHTVQMEATMYGVVGNDPVQGKTAPYAVGTAEFVSTGKVWANQPLNSKL